MNPYTQSVINATMPLMQQQNALSQNQAANQANSANAFGGSRQGVQQGVAQAQGAMNIGQMAAQLNQANFTPSAARRDRRHHPQPAGADRQPGGQSGQHQFADPGGAAASAPSAPRRRQNQRQQFLECRTAGAGQQAQAQNQINANMGQFNQAQAYPGQQLGVLQSALGMTPYGSTTMGSVDRADAADDDPVADVRRDRRLAGARRHAGAAARSAPAARSPDCQPAQTGTSRPTSRQIGVHAPTGLPHLQLPLQGRSEELPQGRPGRWPRT